MFYSKIIAILISYSLSVYFFDFVFLDSFFRGSIVSLLMMYVYMIIFDIYFMIASGYYLVNIAKNIEPSIQNRFNHEKKWYYMYMSLLGIMIFTWIMELLCWEEEVASNLSLSVIADLTKLFTSINIFIIFVLRKSVQELLFNKYRSLRGNFSASDFEINK